MRETSNNYDLVELLGVALWKNGGGLGRFVI